MTNKNQHPISENPLPYIAPAVNSSPSIAVPELGKGEVVSSPTLTFENHHTDFANFQEEYVRSYINLADTKAGFTFTIASGVLVYLIGTPEIRYAILDPSISIAYFALGASLILLVNSAFYSFQVIAPRLHSKSNEGIVFFGSVASKIDAKQYISEVSALSASELTELRLKHCFDVSVVCYKKYSSLKKAIWFGLPALIVTLSALLLNIK